MGMPVVQRSTYYSKPWYFLNSHMETIIPSMFYDVKDDLYERERIQMGDGDFLDLDWIRKDSKKLMIITHGLEGSSERYYVKRQAKFISTRGFDVLAWNCRSCSGEMNLLPRFYHHGDTEDLRKVVDHSCDKDYDQIVLVGFSMGGSMTLKYLGEGKVDDRIKGAVTFSVPCNLRDSADQLEKRSNRIYEKRFLKKLKVKIELKSKKHKEINVDDLEGIVNFNEFHRRYTVPLHGFDNLDDFYSKSTCDQYFDGIAVPVLIVNAKNDPLLGPKCYPVDLVSRLKHVFLETPKVGGHVGFTSVGNEFSWMESRGWEFMNEVILK